MAELSTKDRKAIGDEETGCHASKSTSSLHRLHALSELQCQGFKNFAAQPLDKAAAEHSPGGKMLLPRQLGGLV